MDNKEKIYTRYVNVLALSIQGVGGEKSNAIRMKEKMERQNPWLIQYHQDILQRVQQTQHAQKNGF